ncbi:MAG: hypothetical protein M1434_10170 [Chloroflexi bacterium]|nr:hypothetical protein [Chloroflexota bacterium]MCL5275091.1 hypothetical protein [Chloroflexota bacterium]
MRETSNLPSTQTQTALSGLFNAIRKKYPTVSTEQAEHLQGKVIKYVSEGLADGYDLALIKRRDGKTTLKVLMLMEEED